jgi:integrase/recombinase XerD
VIFLLSAKAGLRAKEIAHLKWGMLLAPDGSIGESIELENVAAKGKSGRSIPIGKTLRTALVAYRLQTFGRFNASDLADRHVVATQRASSTTPQVIVNLFQGWYKSVGLVGCSSHSGRRTFITNAARKITTVGGSLRDVQALAGHSSLQTTQRYIEAHSEARKRVVDLV